MKVRFSLLLLAAGATAVSLAAASPARAAVIISDNFSANPNVANLAGTTPDVADLPGGTWSVSSGTTAQTDGASNSTYYGIPSPLAFIWNNGNNAPATSADNGAATISLASNGTYVEPTQLRISADLYTSPAGRTTATAGPSGLMIGFYGTTPATSTSGNSMAGFSGLVVDNAGNVTLVNDGTVGPTVAYTGTYTSTVYNPLSYDVNTTTGAISDVSLAGNTNYNFTSAAFTNANYAAIGVTAPDTNSNGGVENFTVQTTQPAAAPEPATVAVAGMGVALLLLSRKRRKLV